MIKKMFRIVSLITLAAFVLTASSATALAHANLVKCNFKNHKVFTTKTLPHQITGSFAEDLNPDHSWMQVFENAGDHGLASTAKSVISITNPKIMTLKLPRLKPLGYYMIWYTHSAQDGHYAAGVVYFTVKKA